MERSMDHRLSGALACVLALAGLLARAAPAQEDVPRYFPLEEGNVWRYPLDLVFDERTGEWVDFLRLGFEVKVLRREGNRVAMRWQRMNFETGEVKETSVLYYRLVDRGNEVDVELPEEGDVLSYAYEEDQFEHRHYYDACADGLAIVESRDEVVVTPIGDLSPCLRIYFTQERNCADGGLLREWWCPDVGLAQWTEEMNGPSVTYTILDFHRNLPRFVRGDGNADGTIDLSDPITLLAYLFFGEKEPGCFDAADADDSGGLEITDAIFLLQWLFRGGTAPPPPTPTTAGQYPPGECEVETSTIDTLDCRQSTPACRDGS